MESASKKLFLSWWVLRITYGLLFILVGSDKFFNLLTQWPQFIGSLVPQEGFLNFFAILQIIAGLLLFTPWLQAGINFMLILLITIFFNLLTAHAGVVVIAHDLMMMVHVYVLWQLTKIMKPK